jgi:hypothetical protein
MTGAITTLTWSLECGTGSRDQAPRSLPSAAHPAGSGREPYDVSELVPRLMHFTDALRRGRVVADSERHLLHRLAAGLLTELAYSDRSVPHRQRPAESLQRALRMTDQRALRMTDPSPRRARGRRRRSPLNVPTAS